MLYTKFCQNWPTISWKEDFYSVFTIYGHCSHLGHGPRTDDGQKDAGPLVYYKLTYEPLAQVS